MSFGLNCSNGDIMPAAIWALTAEYLPAITNAKLQGELSGNRMTFEMSISTAWDIYKIQTLEKQQHADNKKGAEVRLATTNQEKKCFKCGKSCHFRKDCPSKNNNQNGNRNATTCHLWGRTGLKMAKYWGNPENASQQSEHYEPKLSSNKDKKKIAENSKSNRYATNSKLVASDSGKTDVQGEHEEVQTKFYAVQLKLAKKKAMKIKKSILVQLALH